ncbi:MAG: hypothetical protein ACYC8T_03985 [Myxococcaceae bacterium]
MNKAELFLVVASVGLLGMSGCRSAKDKGGIDRRNRVSGERLVTALSAYQRDAGRLPDRLGELVPRVLPELPMQSRHADGGEPSEFSYEVSEDGGRFLLIYGEAPIGTFAPGYFEYDSAAGQWVLIPD